MTTFATALLATDAPAVPLELAPVSFRHLLHLSDEVGVFEHAELTAPRREHGYCLDDVARAFIVTVRQPDHTVELAALASTYLNFVLDAQGEGGKFRNRRAVDRSWSDEPTVEDCWGRALWALGTGVARAPEVVDWRAAQAFTAGAAAPLTMAEVHGVRRSGGGGGPHRAATRRGGQVVAGGCRNPHRPPRPRFSG